MNVIATIAPYQWRAYWRGLRRKGELRGAEMSLVLIVAVLMFPAHVVACVFAAKQIHSGATHAALLLTDGILLHTFATWLVAPVLVQSVDVAGRGISPARLSQFPLTMPQLLGVIATGAFVQPLYMALAALSVVSLAPLAFAPRPALGLAAGVLFIAACALISWTIGIAASAIFSARRAREAAMLALSVLIVGCVFVAKSKIAMDGENVMLTLGKREVLLANKSGTEGLLIGVGKWTPGGLATRAAAGERPLVAIGTLAATVVAAAGVAMWAVRRLVRQPVVGLGGASRSARRRRAILGVRGAAARALDRFVAAALGANVAHARSPSPALGVAIQKEIRYLSRSMDTLIGLGVGAGTAAYVLLRPGAHDTTLLFAAAIVVLVEMAIPLNAFGLDGRAVDRYRLLPLSGTEVILSKNVAAACVAAVQLAPLFVAGVVRFGASITASIALWTAANYLLTMTWGNLISVRAPAPRAFYNFESAEQSGGIISIILTIVLWVASGGAWFLLDAAGRVWLIAGEAALAGVAFAIYRVFLQKSGRLFDAMAEPMRERMSA
jgi:hypothetical protein